MKAYETGRRYSQLPSVKGRPKKFQSVEELEDLIEKYFKSCFVKIQRRELVRGRDPEDPDSEAEYAWVDTFDAAGNPMYEMIKQPSVTGLANALDTTRETLLDYENKPENAQFSDAIKRAKGLIHEYAENYLYEGKNQTGGIFSLKNNFGWVDRTETDLTTKGDKINPAVVAAKVDDILK